MLTRIAAAAIAATAVSSAGAAILVANVTLLGINEVPPNGSPGIGNAVVTIDDVSGAVTVNGTFSGLLANATAAHIHGLAGPGVNAGVLIPLTVTPSTSGTLTGGGILAGANLAGAIAGLTYLNIHTTVF